VGEVFEVELLGARLVVGLALGDGDEHGSLLRLVMRGEEAVLQR